MTFAPDAPVCYVDLSNLCRDERLLTAGTRADFATFELFLAAVELTSELAVSDVRAIADRSLIALLPSTQRAELRRLERDGRLEFSQLADERLLIAAFDSPGETAPPLIASMDHFDDYRRVFPQIQGCTDRFIGWAPAGDALRVYRRDMEVHHHQRLSRKEESAEFKARRLRRDSVVSRAVATYFVCRTPHCLLAQLWPDRIPELPEFDGAIEAFVCPSCGAVLETGPTRPPAVDLIVFLHGVEKFRIVVDEGKRVEIGRRHQAGCIGLEGHLGESVVGAVSRRHLAFALTAGRATVEDLGSRNGTVLRSPAGDTRLVSHTPVGLTRRDVVAMPSGITIELSGRSVPRRDDGPHGGGEGSPDMDDRATRVLKPTQH